MRVTVDTAHKDYISPENRQGIKTFLNDVEQTDVYAADEEKGTITKVKKDKDDRRIVKDGQVQIETICGSVKINFPR
ncbi:hypothetical protein [Bartonella sp. LJL80]